MVKTYSIDATLSKSNFIPQGKRWAVGYDNIDQRPLKHWFRNGYVGKHYDVRIHLKYIVKRIRRGFR